MFFHFNFVYTHSNDCEIVIFNVDNPIHGNHLSLNWYKRVLFNFYVILLCLPLSWFEKLRKICACNRQSWKHDKDIELIYNKFIRLTNFHKNTVEYDDKRKITRALIEKIKHAKRKKLINKYGSGTFIPQSLQEVDLDLPPYRSVWICPDFKNIVKNLANSSGNQYRYGGYDIKQRWKNQGPAMFLSKNEQNFIENLTNWRDIMLKHNNRNCSHSKEHVEESMFQKLADRMDERDDLKTNNQYYKDLIDYNRITINEWKLLKKVTFLKTLKYFNILNEYTDNPYHKNNKINQSLVKLTNGIDPNDKNDIKSKQFDSKFKEYTSMYVQLCNRRVKLNSEFKRRMHEVYLHIPNSKQVQQDVPQHTSLMHDYRLEYFRLRLNYPSIYKNDPRLLLRNDYNFNNEYLHRMGFNNNQFIRNCNVQFEKHFNNTHIFYQMLTMSMSDAGGIIPLNMRQNVELSSDLNNMFRFAMVIVCTNFKQNYYVHNYDVDVKSGIVVEKCLDFAYKVRLDALIQNRQLFNDLDLNWKNVDEKENKGNKQKMNDTLGNIQDFNDDNSDNDFQFENYLRIAFSDWNMARLGLIAKVIGRGKVSAEAANCEAYVVAEGLFDDDANGKE